MAAPDALRCCFAAHAAAHGVLSQPKIPLGRIAKARISAYYIAVIQTDLPALPALLVHRLVWDKTRVGAAEPIV